MLTLVACNFHVGESGDFDNVKLDLTCNCSISEDKCREYESSLHILFYLEQFFLHRYSLCLYSLKSRTCSIPYAVRKSTSSRIA